MNGGLARGEDHLLHLRLLLLPEGNPEQSKVGVNPPAAEVKAFKKAELWLSRLLGT